MAKIIKVTAFAQTKKLMLQIAREHNVVASEVEQAVILLEDAFYSYGKAWEGFHTVKETREQWEYPLILLRENKDNLANFEKILKEDKYQDQWTKDLTEIARIISGKTDKD